MGRDQRPASPSIRGVAYQWSSGRLGTIHKRSRRGPRPLRPFGLLVGELLLAREQTVGEGRRWYQYVLAFDSDRLHVDARRLQVARAHRGRCDADDVEV